MKKFLLALIFLYSTTFQPTFASELELNKQLLKIVNITFQCEITSGLTNLSAPTFLKVMSTATDEFIKELDEKSQNKLKLIKKLGELPPTQAEYRELQTLHFKNLKCRRQMIDSAPLFNHELHKIIATYEWAWDKATKENKPIKSYLEISQVPLGGELSLFEEKLNLANPNDQNILRNQMAMEADRYSKKIDLLTRELIEKIYLYLKD